MMQKWGTLNRNLLNGFFWIFLLFSFTIGFPAHSEAANPMVRLETTRGDITIELYPDQAPKTVANFLFYVTNGFYDGRDGNGGTIFHRVIDDFVIQGGGFTSEFYSLPNPGSAQKNTTFPIPNEADNGLKHERYSIAMARTPHPHSATSQFFINLKDNPNLDFTAQTNSGWGYTVFGRVVNGTDVVNGIGSVPTTNTAFAPFLDVPESPITVTNAVIEGMEDLTMLNQTLYYSPAVLLENWGTDICIINGSGTEPLNGLLRAYFSNGQPVSGVAPVMLPPNGRTEMAIQNVFPNAQFISHFKFQTASDSALGYSTVYGENVYRASVPAVKETGQDTLSVPFTISGDGWFTVISLLNTGSETRTIEIELDGTDHGEISMPAGQHAFIFAKDLFGEDASAGIHSAVFRNASDIIGHAFIGTAGNSHYLSGFNLNGGGSELYYPLLITTPEWWTGLAVHNPSPFACELRIKPFTSNGIALGTRTMNLEAGGKLLGMAQDLNLPADAAWIEVEATDLQTGAEHDIAGLELIGTHDGRRMAGFSAIETSTTSGVLPKIEPEGWSAFFFVNTAFSRARVDLIAYDDRGASVATAQIAIGSRSQNFNFAEAFFGVDISSATHIRYTSDKEVVTFHVNASADNMMLEGLESLSLR